jgi:hypothetical protein
LQTEKDAFLNDVLGGIGKITIFSPHFDDTSLSLGGFLFEAGKYFSISNLVIASISQYVSPDYPDKDKVPGTPDDIEIDDPRTKYVTKLRKGEDKAVMETLGVESLLLDELDGPLRGYGVDTKDGFTSPTAEEGWWKNSNEIDYMARLKEQFKTYLQEEGNVFIPLALNYHIDHVLVRMAALQAAKELGDDLKANIFFYEDLPYAGLSKEDEPGWADANKVIEMCDTIDIAVDLDSKVKIAVNGYPSQLEDTYEGGVRARANTIGALYDDVPHERIYKLDKDKLAEFSMDNLDHYLR